MGCGVFGGRDGASSIPTKARGDGYGEGSSTTLTPAG